MACGHVIWDFNGTLLDDAELAVWCDNQVFAELGLPPVTLGQYRRHMQVPMSGFYQALGVDLTRTPYDHINKRFLFHFNGNVHRAGLRPDALAAIESLARAGIGQSVLSASYEPTLQSQARDLGLTPWMGRITGLLDNQAGHKQERGRWHIEALDLSPGDVVCIGDTLGDVLLSRALGIRCILVEGGHTSRERLAETGLPVAGSLTEAAQWAGEGKACTTATEGD